MMQPLILIGYFPKKVSRRPDWLTAAGVIDIRSVCECVSSGPADWIQRWTHNQMWVYSTIAAAWEVVPTDEQAEYELQAYRLLPTKWDEGIEKQYIIPPLEVEPLPVDFQSLGFDVVSIENGTAGFGHSPLSCNHMAQEIATNKDCLLDDIEVAKKTAAAFSSGDVEPGPYFVVEVSICKLKAAPSFNMPP
jgi:hypothetical protein